jgi:hypothetical protein
MAKRKRNPQRGNRRNEIQINIIRQMKAEWGPNWELVEKFFTDTQADSN